MVERVSLLVFSRDNIEKAISLVEDMYEYVDDIVLVDSSRQKAHKSLLKQISSRKIGKLQVFYAIALGYPDPLRMYALQKCKYRWVLMIDTDERVSADLKKDLHSLVESSGASAISIKRYEEVNRGMRSAYVNWQTRLFRKDKVEYRGIIHEEPIVNGSVKKLENDDYYIDHVAQLRGNTAAQYSVMEKFLRMSYKTYNERMLDYFYKTTVPENPKKAGSGGGTLYFFLLLYEKLGFKHLEDEISNLDYFIFYYLMAVATSLKSHKIGGVVFGVADASVRSRQMRSWQSERDGAENFEISKKLYEVGLIKYLGLDKEQAVLELNRKYRNKKQGIGLLIALLKERYESNTA
ncbi:MAG: hypothetical protein KGH64_02290 [Candidatus Micrarchaeota archaeon]|nr:hypothetical protein [Candidatus Micrarchaeota archaeon]MDE1834145.1 hypothetical protein [Candidatus Micrarchaeota archaeon]MDE1859528.1 hypothetical protein [Candidatus Micrarchaeota archaeon]